LTKNKFYAIISKKRRGRIKMKEIMEVEGQKVVRMQRHKERGIDLTFNKEKKTIFVRYGAKK